MRRNDSEKNGLVELVNFVAKNSNGKPSLVMIEIGSYAGQSMEVFAGTGKIRKIICVDPWKKGYDPKDPASSTDMDEVERLFDERAGKARSKGVDVIKYKGTIDTFVLSDDFRRVSGEVDFVYVDGCHQYGAVKHDIETCLSVVKPCVAVCGHDYNARSWSNVIKAINDSIGEPDMKFKDTSWAKLVKSLD